MLGRFLQKHVLQGASLFIALMAPTMIARAQGQNASDIAHQALTAMGGEEKLDKIQKTEAHFSGHVFAIEQSERPEGPWFTAYTVGQVTTDFANLKQSLKGRADGIFFPDGQDVDASIDFTDPAAPKLSGQAYGFSAREARERLALGPERLLQTSLAAKDLRLGPTVKFHGVPNDVLQFTWGATLVRVFVNRYTHLPAAVETFQVGDGYWATWGDVTNRTVWGNWDFAPGGVLLPTLWSVEKNGFQHENFTLTKVNVTYADSPLPLGPSSSLSASEPKPRLLPFKALDIAPGVVQYQSAYNCVAVDQGDGVVMLEGPFSSEYASNILEDVARRFPGRPIKAVVTTDDAWPHIGGLRTFAARGIPVYALSLNGPILTRLFQARFTIRPDELAKAPRRPELHLIDRKTSIGKGPNAIDLYPLHGAGTERMLYAFFPATRLLYAPDVIQYQGDQWFSQNILSEMINAATRDRIEPTTAFAFHSGPIPYSKLVSVVEAAKSSK